MVNIERDKPIKEKPDLNIKNPSQVSSEIFDHVHDQKLNQKNSRDWLASFANDYNISYDELIVAATNWLENNDWYYGPSYGSDTDGGGWYGSFTGGEYIDDPETFWMHFQNATGLNVPDDKVGNFFTCSC
jgi:hypothetical protein